MTDSRHFDELSLGADVLAPVQAAFFTNIYFEDINSCPAYPADKRYKNLQL
jgi:hypothetical protein